MDVQAKPCYKRILLKLSGEALMGEDSFGINRAVLQHMIEELRTALDLGMNCRSSHTSSLALDA